MSNLNLSDIVNEKQQKKIREKHCENAHLTLKKRRGMDGKRKIIRRRKFKVDFTSLLCRYKYQIYICGT